MSNWKVPESLVDWLNVTEHDGVLTTENTNVSENEDVLTSENVIVTEPEGVLTTENISITESKNAPTPENIRVTEQEGGIDTEKIGVTENDGVMSTETTAQFLTGESFLSHCWLPDVKPNTKILGICGITDWNEENDPTLPGAAAPNQEGWHFADFYLFHHMLKGVASDQVWLTCVSPKYAVEKYGRYVYGDYSPKKVGTRRVVLEESKLCELNDVQTVSPESLLDTALATISKTCIEATDEGRPVLILIFSRGTQPDYSIVMGGEAGEDTKLLTRESFRQAVGSQAPEAGLCLFATEYHTGAWAINPDMKVAPVASQGKYLESLAWPISGTIHKRPCGPEFAYAISDMLLRLNIVGYETKVNDGNRGNEFDEFEEKLEETVERILRQEESKDKSLLSGYDEWETEYAERTGIPSGELHRRYSLLKDAAPGYDELLAVVKSKADVYLNSFPGLDYKSKNLALHNELRGTIKGTRSPTFLGLEYLRCQIDYRLKQMKMATAYKDFWGLAMDNCEDVEVEIGSGVGTYRWCELLKRTYYLFDDSDEEGPEYSKGAWYIASCIHSQKWNEEQVEERLQSALNYKVACTLISLVLCQDDNQLTETVGSNVSDSNEPIVCSQRQQDYGFSDDQEFSALKIEAKQYFYGKQRARERPSDLSVHSCLRRALDGDRTSDIRYSRTRADYRINEIMGTATLYKDFLGIDYPGCHEVDVEEFRCDSDTTDRCYKIEKFIFTYPLFNSYGVYPYRKGKSYLAQCMSLQEWSKSDSGIIAKFDSLVQYRESPRCPLYDWGTHLNPDYSYSGVPAIKGASRALETINQFRLSRTRTFGPPFGNSRRSPMASSARCPRITVVGSISWTID
ncbi:hypothetical protein V490_00107 [Pseudogymnoascus sp. VKM F-3557]|nr:hypothetical protein V490_00107 [Pseudogymnoascus sp. VKM F-3557]